MVTAAFATLGCKVNQYETQRILDDFEERGFAITEFNEPADVYVINTCSVTQAAERKSRSLIRKLARQNPDAVIVMTGCYGEMAGIKGETVDEVSLHVPNHQKLDTLNHLINAYPSIAADISQSTEPKHSHVGVTRRTRATVKVQDGCNVFCSFCSIPYTRKYMHSRPVSEIEREVEGLAEQGYKEIVITGVLVGAYGQDGFTPIPVSSIQRVNMQSVLSQDNSPYDLSALLLRLARVNGIERVRLSSIEPTQVTEKLIGAFASEPRLCPHLHIPLQSGDTGVLKLMNRPYNSDFYLERCREAYASIPNLAITSDIMVGFPGEDRNAFENTLKVVTDVGFARAHVFRFSARPNTPAAEMCGEITESEKVERAAELSAACRMTQNRFVQRNLGLTLPVLVEGKEKHLTRVATRPSDQSPLMSSNGVPGALLSGYTHNYIRVQFTGGSHLTGSIANVTLIEPLSEGALGEVGGAHFGPDEAPPDADFIPLSTMVGHISEPIEVSAI